MLMELQISWDIRIDALLTLKYMQIEADVVYFMHMLRMFVLFIYVQKFQ